MAKKPQYKPESKRSAQDERREKRRTALTGQEQYGVWTATRTIRKGDRKVAECPACENIITLSSRLAIGDRIECPECGEQLEVISLRPPELDYVFDDDDDWDDEDWEDEDD